MNIVYRKAKVEDYDGIYYVSCYSWDETYRGLLPDEYLDDRINNYEERKLRTKKFLEKLEEAGDLDKYLVCEVDSKIVGICQWSKQYFPSVYGKNLDYQLSFLKKTIQGEFKTFGYKYKKSFNYSSFCKLKDAKAAALAFAKVYERCGSQSYSVR
jgi:hypothetical protein